MKEKVDAYYGLTMNVTTTSILSCAWPYLPETNCSQPAAAVRPLSPPPSPPLHMSHHPPTFWSSSAGGSLSVDLMSLLRCSPVSLQVCFEQALFCTECITSVTAECSRPTILTIPSKTLNQPSAASSCSSSSWTPAIPGGE